MDRRQKALAHVDLEGRGLEIGPSYDPLVPRSSGARVETVDHAARAELVDKYRGYGVPEDKIGQIEDVDHVWTKGSLVDVVGEPGAFAYIIASHVIEHTVDLIGFLQDCSTLLTNGGRISLVIPDKRFCFDAFLPLTTVGDVVDGHLSGSRFHPPGSILDHYAYASQRGAGVIAWDGATTAPLSLQFPDLRSGREAMESAKRQEAYVDVHRWRFTPTSFRLLLRDLRELGFHELAEVGGFETHGFEFFITLARTGAEPRAHDRLAMLEQIESELRLIGESSTTTGPGTPEGTSPPPDPWIDEEWDAYCSICGQRVTFHAYGPWYRDHLVCTTCGSIPRQRALMLVLSIVRPDWRRTRLWDIAPSGPGSAKLQRECTAYLGSHYWPGVPPGTMVDGVRCEDLERPSLPDGSMDVIVSSDVFEHVVDIDQALAQVARVLAPDGLHVWTTPRHSTLGSSKPRVRRGTTGLEYLEPAEFRRDPACADRDLVTFDWGQDLPARVASASGLSTAVFRIESRALGLVGEFLEVFVSHRGPGNPVAYLERREGAVAMEVDRLRMSLSTSEHVLSQVLASKSWRVTRPLRALSRAIRR